MKKLRKLIKAFSLSISLVIVTGEISFAADTTVCKPLNYGPHKVGFKTVRKVSQTGDTLLISLWYPAAGTTHKMLLQDYIEAGDITGSYPKSRIVHFSELLARLYGETGNMTDQEFKHILTTLFIANNNAVIEKGQFPLVIAQAEPSGYIDTFEFLASHGYVVATFTMNRRDVTDDRLIYKQTTDAIEYLLNYMSVQSYVKQSDIAAFSHGGGIQPAFYLAMKTKKLKCVINIDGGVFGHRSKTTESIYYKPQNLTTPMLYLASTNQQAEDDTAQIRALKNPLFELDLTSPSVHHHDFTILGRVIDCSLNRRGSEGPVARKFFYDTQNLVLLFLKNRKLSQHDVASMPVALKIYNVNTVR